MPIIPFAERMIERLRVGRPENERRELHPLVFLQECLDRPRKRFDTLFTIRHIRLLRL